MSLAAGFLQYAFERFILVNMGVLSPSDLQFASYYKSASSFWSTHFAPFPSAAYYDDDFASTMQFAFGILMILSVLWPFSRVVRNLVEEKETRTRESLRMLGVSNFMFWFSWFVSYLIGFFPIALLFLWLASSSFMPNTNAFLVFLMYMLFIANVLLMACVCSTMFDRAKNAGTLSPFMLIVSYFPYFASYAANSPGPLKYLTSLMPPVAFQLLASSVFDFETFGTGVTFSNIATVHNNVTVLGLMLMLIADLVVFTFLAWYLDKVIPSEFGVTEKPWFCLLPSYWSNHDESDFGNLNHRSNSNHVSVSVTNHQPLIGSNPHSDLIEPLPAGLASEPGVFIHGLKKQFLNDQGEPFWAVRGMDLTMHRGEIFVLLGHNGALAFPMRVFFFFFFF
jgi:hypothetical protein